MSELDPTYYGPEATKAKAERELKEKLEKRAQVHSVITGDERLVKLREITQSLYSNSVDVLLSEKATPEEVASAKAKAQVFRIYLTVFERMEKEGVKAIERLRELG